MHGRCEKAGVEVLTRVMALVEGCAPKKLADVVTGEATAIGVVVRQAERQHWSKDSCEQVLISAMGGWHMFLAIELLEPVSREDGNQPISNSRMHRFVPIRVGWVFFVSEGGSWKEVALEEACRVLVQVTS